MFCNFFWRSKDVLGHFGMFWEDFWGFWQDYRLGRCCHEERRHDLRNFEDNRRLEEKMSPWMEKPTSRMENPSRMETLEENKKRSKSAYAGKHRIVNESCKQLCLSPQSRKLEKHLDRMWVLWVNSRAFLRGLCLWVKSQRSDLILIQLKYLLIRTKWTFQT